MSFPILGYNIKGYLRQTFTDDILNSRTSSKDREIMKTTRESIGILDTDVDYPTVVSTKSAQAQVAVKGEDRLRDTGDHNRWKNRSYEPDLTSLELRHPLLHVELLYQQYTFLRYLSYFSVSVKFF